ncbi:MAG: indolepyruvate ferredoxin oxidoreductase subunit alpha [Rhodospirillales bacterium]|nr:indolepyruvate ferredoxin oxidoreductase subunit alpha [Rhodospirillales bacterium]MDH3969878.1 indolepyruvate ferredoxin oxidoreductase subunit alpha [Rhodospirillales bacterium]
MDQLAETARLKQSTEASFRPMTGNEAIARGAWEAGVRVAAAYPGTPSTEILENVGTYPAEDLHAQWSTNEKVACDVAIGASFAGVRALTVMKHVGLNVASDALMSQTYIGVNGGLVAVVCDDPGIHSSQNEQDTRLFSRLAMIPVLEPADAQEALEFTRWAFDISENFDTPVIVRSTTRLSHTRSVVELGERSEPAPRGFLEDPSKNVMIPSHARARHPALLERETKLRAYFASPDFTPWERGDGKVGVVTLGTPYTYVKEVLPGASVLKLAASYPLANELVAEFCRSVERVFVVEELEPVIENEIRALGFEVAGKAFFPRVGELSPELVREGFEKAGILERAAEPHDWDVEPIARPPVLCAGCPHTTTYMALRSLDARVAGDIGCYTLAAVEPLRSIDTCVSMGSSIANAAGMAKTGVETKPIVATIGDSTFLHSGIPPLIDAVYNKANITVILLDNHVTAMTGGQEHPGTGRTLRGEETHRVDYEELIRSVGVTWVKTVDSYDVGAMYRTFREAVEHKGVSVVISNRPCVLDPVKIRGPVLAVRAENCIACQTCMNLGCPAISWSDEWHDGHHKVKIDAATCIGCTLCSQICPTDCIQPAAG